MCKCKGRWEKHNDKIQNAWVLCLIFYGYCIKKAEMGEICDVYGGNKKCYKTELEKGKISGLGGRFLRLKKEE